MCNLVDSMWCDDKKEQRVDTQREQKDGKRTTAKI